MDKSVLGPAPAPVLLLFRKVGLIELDVGQSEQPWWKDGKGMVGPWTVALDSIGDELISLRATVSRLPRAYKKPFWKTSEFWMAIAGTSAAAGTAVSQLASDASSLPAPWNTIVGAIGAVLGISMPVGYSFARALAKQTAEEEHKSMPETEPDTDPSQEKP